MNAEDIASKEFPVVLRGYGREEVQAFLAGIAAQLAERDARMAELEAELARARREHQPTNGASAAVSVDRTVLLRHLGEEAASILACADASAERMKAQAGIAAQRVRHELHGIGSSLVDVHQLLGELVSLVQSLTEGNTLVAPAGHAGDGGEVSVAEVGNEVRSVLADVLGLDGGTEISLPDEAPAQGGTPTS